jgi:hypothetical protein
MSFEKNKSFPGVDNCKGSRHKERENEGEYGTCILYPYMKIEE